MSIVEEAFQIEVPPALLEAAVGAFGDTPPGDRRSFEGRAIRLFRLLKDRREPGDHGTLAFAIQLRLEALARLHDDRGLRAWTLRGDEEGMDYVHADVVRAAAAEPLVALNEHEVGFAPESFRTRVLASAETRGSA